MWLKSKTPDPLRDADVAFVSENTLLPRISIGIFVTDPDFSSNLELAERDRRLSRATVMFKRGGIRDAANHYSSSPSPSLIIVEADKGPREMFADLEKLASECLAETKVIVIGHHNDVEIYRKLIESGVSEYLVGPISPTTAIDTIAKIFNHAIQKKLGRVIAFLGTRGGVGSSMLAHNVAAELSTMPTANPLLVDMDMPFGTANLDLNIQAQIGAEDLLTGSDAIDEGLLERLTTTYRSNLRVLGTSGTLDRPSCIQSGQVERLIEVIHSISCNAIFDLPMGWTDWSRYIIKQADAIVVTATPDLSSLKNAKNILRYCEANRPNDRPPLIIINQIGTPKKPEITLKDFSEALSVPVIEKIAYDAKLFGTAANNGQLISDVAPNSSPTRSIRALATTISGRTSSRAVSKNPFARFILKAS